MAPIVILGAGELGGSLARHLAAADIVSDVILVDEMGAVAQGKALDIRQAAPIDGYSTAVSGTSDVAAVAGACFVVLADQAAAPGMEWQDDAAVRLLSTVAGLCGTAPLLCAGARQAGAIERGVREVGIPRSRILGSAPEGLRSAIIAMTALEAGCTPMEVSLTVVGRPPNQIIVPWEDASIAGRRATSVLSPPAITRLDARLARLWPPGPMTLAGAATRIVAAALASGAGTFSAFVAVSRDEGRLGRVGILPVSVSPSGLDGVVAPRFSTRDQVRLDTALYS